MSQTFISKLKAFFRETFYSYNRKKTFRKDTEMYNHPVVRWSIDGYSIYTSNSDSTESSTDPDFYTDGVWNGGGEVYHMQEIIHVPQDPIDEIFDLYKSCALDSYPKRENYNLSNVYNLN